MAGRSKWAPAIAACALGLVAGSAAGTALAQGNPGARASLSWTSTPGTLDLVSPSLTQSLYVHFSGLREWKGAEINLVWDPAGDGTSCAAHVGTLFRTASDCSFLNRGTSVPITEADDPGHLHMAWANNAPAQCESGVGVVLQFEFDGCSSYAGCFALTAAWVVDGASTVSTCQLVNSVVTVRGGGAGACGPGSKAASWGRIKSIFRR